MLSTLLTESSLRHPDKIVLISNDESYTYQQLDSASTQLADGLLELGIKIGDRIAFCLSNGVESFYIYFACFKIGAIPVPIYVGSRGHDLVHIMTLSEPAVLITDQKHAPQFLEIESHYSPPPHVFLVDAEDPQQLFSTLFNNNSAKQFPQVNQETLSTLYFTSGSTNAPKGVLRTHDSLLQDVIVSVDQLHMQEGAHVLLTSGMDFIPDLLLTLVAIYKNGTIVQLPEVTIEGIVEAIEKYPINHMIGTPSRYKAMCDLLKTQGRRIKHHFVSCNLGGDLAPLTVFESFKEVFGQELFYCWGMTEIVWAIAMPYPYDQKYRGSVGKPWHDVSIRLVDEAGHDVPDNQEGELWVKSPRLTCGYWRDPENTALALTQGWFRTGDLAKRTQDGYIWISGRKKFTLKSPDGDNIAPAELEAVLIQHPAVDEVGVTGLESPSGGDLIIALVCLKPGVTCTAQVLINLAKKELADYKTPHKIFFVDMIPKNSRNKMDRLALKTLAKSFFTAP